MDWPNQDKRRRWRRALQVPVICYPSGGKYDPRRWIFGRTLDVGTDGLRICFRGRCLLEPGLELNLLIFDHKGQQHRHQEDVPACIQARIAWVDQGRHIFGAEYINNTRGQ